jgi:endoglucanase
VTGTPNPLAGVPWGVYDDPRDGVWQVYQSATGADRKLAAKVALQPRVRWFGVWNGYDGLTQTVQRYIQYTTNGDPNALTQFAVFRATPWEGQTCTRPPTADEQAAYKQWIVRFAAAIGQARAAIVLQPDLPIALQCSDTAAATVKLTYFAAQTFSKVPNATIYLDAGAADWASVDKVTSLLVQAGVRYARGFSLNASHSDSTRAQVLYGAQLAQSLAAHGYPDRHFVVNTAANGRPFTHAYYREHYRAKYGNSAPACRTSTQRRCVTLGIPPTAAVASRRWLLGPAGRRAAARYCDGYLWIGRPWIASEVFDHQRALDIERTTPW